VAAGDAQARTGGRGSLASPPRSELELRSRAAHARSGVGRRGGEIPP
jgi:hypothetical protein